MSERPIQVGDLVQVVNPKPCCKNIRFLSDYFVVSALWGPGATICSDCRKDADVVAYGHHCGKAIDIRRLKRIPPLEELEGQRTQESLRKPKKVAA